MELMHRRCVLATVPSRLDFHLISFDMLQALDEVL